MKNKQLLFGTLLTAGSIFVGAAPAFAWTAGEEDTSTQYQEVEGADSATIPAEGTFEKFDPSNPGTGPDPTDPIDWVDVNVPTKVLFGATDATDGIVSPVYKIENNSAKGVKISVKNFVKGENADQLPEMTLSLNDVKNTKSVSLVDPVTEPSFPAEITTLASKAEPLNFSLSGDVGNGYNFGQDVSPKYDLVLQFEAIL